MQTLEGQGQGCRRHRRQPQPRGPAVVEALVERKVPLTVLAREAARIQRVRSAACDTGLNDGGERSLSG